MKIKFEHVCFSYQKKGKKALNDINLVFDKSELVFIMGHTGSGKSTLVQHLNGLLLCQAGKVSVNIDDMGFILKREGKEKKLNKLRKEMGLVFQFPEYQLFETTVLKDVMFGPYNFFKDEKSAKQMAVRALEKMGIDESYHERSPFDLSGGEKRKIAIAGVLASNPSVVVMDEPTSSLDPIATRETMELLVSLKNEGKLVIVISHDADLCYEYADRVIVMNEGEVIADRSISDVFNDKELLRKANLVNPFVNRAKETLGIKDTNVRSIRDLKEVIKHG